MKQFIAAFVLSAFFIFAAIYGLILAVDPYNKFGYNVFGFETKAVSFARENKYNQVEHAKQKYTAFIMGTSSAHRYYTKDLNRLTGLVSYNYSTQSATPEDYIAMTRHIFTKYKPKLIMISFGFEDLNKFTVTDDMFYSSPLKKHLQEVPAEELERSLFNNSYLTLGAIADSLNVIWVNLFGKARHAYLEHGDHIVEPTDKTLMLSQAGYSEYEIDPKRIEYLKTLKKICDENGTKVVVLTTPLSLEHLNLIRHNPKIAAQFEKYKMTLVEIFGELWDFQHDGIAPYSTLEYFRDSIHPNHHLSTLVLEDIFGTAGPKIGKLIKK